MMHRTAFYLSLLLLAACGDRNNDSGTTTGYNPDDCDGSIEAPCLLPYPNNQWLQAKVLNRSGDFFGDDALLQLPDNLHPSKLLAGASGFSPATPIIFPVSESQASSLSDSIRVFRLSDGQQSHINVNISNYAANAELFSSTAILAEVFPRSRWDFGEQYLAVLLAEATDAAESADENKQKNTIALNYLNEQQQLSALAELGIDADSVLAATVFTIRGESEVKAPIQNAYALVKNQNHAIRNLRIEYFDNDPIFSAELRGELKSLDFRKTDGSMQYDTSAPSETWIQFRVWYPATVRNSGSAPIAVYGHGITADMASGYPFFEVLAKQGIASIAINQPNHGDREEVDGGAVTQIFGAEDLNRIIGMVSQSPIDFMNLLASARTVIGQLDVLPRANFSSGINPIASDTISDGVPDLDSQNIMYLGTSLGGVLGASFLANSSDLDAAYIQVSGVGIIHILSSSILWESLFYKLMPTDLKPEQALTLRALMTQPLDYADAINVVDQLDRTADSDLAQMPFAVTAANNDAIVTNPSTIALAELAKLSTIGEEYFEISEDTLNLSDWDQGSGLNQSVGTAFSSSGNSIISNDIASSIANTTGRLAHLSTLSDKRKAVLDDWVSRFFYAKP